jgi:hypothetical protein
MTIMVETAIIAAGSLFCPMANSPINGNPVAKLGYNDVRTMFRNKISD